ncbi:MAG: SMP-30/gluconolactonase/LRE family protein [Solirubrobacteraceae bacterium]|nr:SMP-30/gluconolactonase/LRE family protein [Solirubrobacteraceae bacterium]
MPLSLPRRALLFALTLLAAASASATLVRAQGEPPCPGASGNDGACAYTSAGVIGDRANGTFRFPQSIAIGTDGNVYVGDQGTHVIQVFSQDGTFLRTVGEPGTRAGELTAVGALAAAPDGSILAADGSNKIERFGADGSHITGWGGTGTAIGKFKFGGGRGNDAGAGGGLAVGGDTVYVADSGNNRLQRFALDGSKGSEIVKPGLLAHPKGLAVRKTRLFVADDQNHRILVLDTGGKQIATIGGGGGEKPGYMNYPYGVALDAAGRVFVADNMNQRVLRFSTGPTYPYKGRWGSYGTKAGQLAYPRGIAIDGSGALYVTNTGNDRIDVFDKGGTQLRSFGKSGRAPGQFNNPTGVAADAAGFRAVTDGNNGRVTILNPDGSVVSEWGSPAPGPTILPRPVDVAFDANGTAYVLDQRRARVVVFGRGTGLPVRTIASQGKAGGQLLDPSALAISGGGTIYVADSGNKRIARFSIDGTHLGSITDTGTVRGIAVSPDGTRLYAADTQNTITVYDQNGNLLDTFGGTGSKLGKLNAPAQMTVDAAGTLWVADRGNNRVQRFGPDGERLLSFGRRGTAAGEFIYPTGVAIDCRGTLTVTDSYNNRVQQFTLAAPSATPCRDLPALGRPPAPQMPTLPAPDGPLLTVRPLRTTGVLSSRQLPIRVGCDTVCTVTTSVTLAPRSQPKKGKRVAITLRSPKVTLPAGESKIVRVSLSRAQAAKLRKALKGKKGLTAGVTVTASASVGSPTTSAQNLRVS